MNADPKAEGKKALHCDVFGCPRVHVSSFAGGTAQGVRQEARGLGWRHAKLSPAEPTAPYWRIARADLCPAHATAPPAFEMIDR